MKKTFVEQCDELNRACESLFFVLCHEMKLDVLANKLKIDVKLEHFLDKLTGFFRREQRKSG